MKTKLTLVKKRTNFQMRVDDNFQKHLDELATMDGISASDVIRILVHREHAARLNGNHSITEICPVCGVRKLVQLTICPICGDEKDMP